MKNKDKSTAQLLNEYINSGGKDATYEDVAAAVRKERFEKFLKNPLKYIWDNFLC